MASGGAPVEAGAKKRSAAQTVGFGSSGSAELREIVAAAEAKIAAKAGAPAATPPPQAAAPPVAKVEPAPVTQAVKTPVTKVDSAPVTSGPVGRGASAEPIPLVVKAHVAPPAPPALPAFEMLSKREDNPSERSPLHYREYVYAVAAGTKEEDAQRLIVDRFEAVRAGLEQARPGKMINLAIFDHVFHGRPQRSPVVTLSWKDWKSEPADVRFPARDGASVPSTPAGRGPAPGSGPAPVRAQPTLTSEEPKVAPAKEKESADKVAVVAASPKAPAGSPAPAVIAPVPVVAVGGPAVAGPIAGRPVVGVTAAPDTPAIATRPSLTDKAPELEKPFPLTSPATAKPVSGLSPLAASVPQPGTTPAKAATPAPVATKEAAPAPAAATKAAPANAAAKATPAPVATKAAPAPVATKAAPAPVATKAAPAPANAAVKPATPAKSATPLPVTAPAKPAKRLSGDDLLSELFESFSDLHFLHDSLEGAEFVLGLTLEKLPSEVGLVSFFDMNKREFIIVRQAGAGRSALCLRQPEKAAIAAAVMRRRHAVLVNERTALERAVDDRWKAVGVELKSLMCAPVELNGRYLGLIELANPLDGSQFSEGDGNALTYIGQQFAEFVASRGVSIDPEHIRESQGAAEAASAPAPAKAPPAKPSGAKAPSHPPPPRRGR